VVSDYAAHVHHTDRIVGDFVEHAVLIKPHPAEARTAEGVAIGRVRIAGERGNRVRDPPGAVRIGSATA
jgi:hypothetical protein